MFIGIKTVYKDSLQGTAINYFRIDILNTILLSIKIK